MLSLQKEKWAREVPLKRVKDILKDSVKSQDRIVVIYKTETDRYLWGHIS